jgi:ABC-2 type transport system ATP-binding protein
LNNILEIRNISKYYAAHTALEDVSINIPKGSIFGLLGPNGAGKTSLIRIITQITGADKGTIFFNGEALAPKHISKIGYLPEERGLYKKKKVGEQLTYLCRLKGMGAGEVKDKLRYWFEKLNITSWWSKNIEDLSKGMQQKVQFIATVLHEPELIILDEPFSGFDPINANIIKDEILLLREKGATIIFSTHRMESVEELCDHFALIDKAKKVLDGKKHDIKSSFKTNTFNLITASPLESLNDSFEVLESENTEGEHYNTKVKIHEGTTNDLLKEVMSISEIHGLKEHIPSINEIFIATVANKKL